MSSLHSTNAAARQQWILTTVSQAGLPLDDVGLANLIAGLSREPVEAGRLDRQLATVLGVPAGTPILLSEYCLLKTKYKHPEIGFREYLMVPWFLRHGFVVHGVRRSASLEIYYFNPERHSDRGQTCAEGHQKGPSVHFDPI